MIAAFVGWQIAPVYSSLFKKRKEVVVRNTTLTQKVRGSDYNAYVKAQSEVLYKLCELISQSMR